MRTHPERSLRLFPAMVVSCMCLFALTVLGAKKEKWRAQYTASVRTGERLMNHGSYEKAILAFERSLKYSRENHYVEGQILSLKLLGLLHWNIGQMKQSSEFYSQGLALARMYGKEEEKGCRVALEIYKYYQDGKRFRKKGQHEEALRSFQEALELAKNSGSAEHELKCMRQLSISYWDTGDLDSFFKLNKEALEIARQLNHRREEGKCLNNIGIFYKRRGKFSSALGSYEKALKLANLTQNLNDTSVYLNNMGNTYRSLGDYDKSIACLQSALKIDRTIGDDVDVIIGLVNLGETLRAKESQENDFHLYRESIDKFYEALEILKNQDKNRMNRNYYKMETRILNNIGIILLDLNRLSSAMYYFEKAFNNSQRISDDEGFAVVSCNIGRVFLKKGKFRNAHSWLMRSIDKGIRMKDSKILWEAFFYMGKCTENLKKYSEALEYYKKSIFQIDTIRSQILLDTFKIGYLRNKTHVYESIINLMYKIRDQYSAMEETLFNIVEMAKARAFLENIEQKNQIAKTLSEEEKLLRSPNLDIVGPFIINDIQKALLDEKTAIIEYFLGQKQSYLFVVERDDFDLFILPSRDEISRSIKGFFKELSDPPRKKFRGDLAAKRLFNDLLGPIEKTLPESIENLIIIPDGILYYLPFEALILGSEHHGSKDKFLIEKFKISYAPSSSSLVTLEKKNLPAHPTKSLLAIGNPNYKLGASIKKKNFPSGILREIYENKGYDFSPIPFTKKEIDKISDFFPKEKIDILCREKASETILKSLELDQYKIVHFACHGLLDERFPLRSALVLSLDSEEDDGFLTVQEIYDLRLAAELVVLSACQTGRGRLENVEGVLGLPRIFFYSGAHSVVASLWRVMDDSTAQFMAHFYRNLSSGKEKSDALRSAKLEMLKSKFSHPHYWAPFVLYGDYSQALN